MLSKYDLVIIYVHKSGRIIKIDDYYPDQTIPIFTRHSVFAITRKSKINIDPTKELYNYGYNWASGVYNIPDMITSSRIIEITLEHDRLDVLEDLLLYIMSGIENYKARYCPSFLMRHLRKANRQVSLELNIQHPLTESAYSTKTVEEMDIQDQLTTEGLDELYKRCYIMYADIGNKIKESENPHETFKQVRRSYFYPLFEQTGTEPVSEAS